MRPTKYKEEYCDILIDLMTDGASIEEVAAEIGVSKQSLYNWTESHPEFLDAKKRGEELSKAWWMKQGRVNLWSKDFSYVGFYMNMKNRFKWTDRQETSNTHEVKGLTIEVSNQETANEIGKLSDRLEGK